MLTIKSKEISKIISKLSNNIRAENLNFESFINLYAGEENISNIDNINNTVIYGRRGSGKTHLLNALREKLSTDFITSRNIPIYIDLRRIIPLASAYDENKEAEALLIFKYIIQNVALALAENLNYILGINEFDKNQNPSSSVNYENFSAQFKEIYIEFDGKKFSKPSESLNVSEEEVKSISGNAELSLQPNLKGAYQAQKKSSSDTTKYSHISIFDITQK